MSSNMKMDIWMFILDSYLFNQNIKEYADTLRTVQKMVEDSGRLGSSQSPERGSSSLAS